MQFLGKERVPIYGWTEGVPVEEKALQQVRNVAVMPDCHWGMGATVGSVIPTIDAIIPAVVGVDIGCGMMALRTSIRAEHLPDSLAVIRSEIEATVPHGRTDNGGANDRGAWGEPLQANIDRFTKDPIDEDATLASWLAVIVEKHPGLSAPLSAL
jgi:tRNA-splicing ligase RtcB (3'-phosphate/5'-hydroxy nucleic acid ligase)